MSVLARTIHHHGETLTVEALYERHIPHTTWRDRDQIRGGKPFPSDASMLRAAGLMDHGSPAQLVQIAAWLEWLDALSEAGLSPAERFEGLLEVLRSPRPGGWVPGPAVLACATEALSPDDVRDLVAALSAAPIRDDATTTVICALPLIRAGEPPPDAADDARLLHLPPSVLREVLRAMPPDRREAALLRRMRTDQPNAAKFALEVLLYVWDLLDTPGLLAGVTRLREVCKPYPGIGALYDKLDAGVVPRGPDGLTERARECFAHWEELRAAERRSERLGPVAEAAVSQRRVVADAAELTSADAWFAATPERREVIAKAVLAALGPKAFVFVGFERDVAVFSPKRKKLPLSLVPGGTFDQGLSEDALDRLRVRVEQAGLTEPYEEWGALLDRIGTLRPVRRVTVGPFLMGQKPGAPLSANELVDWLEAGPWRLPTESEWEHAARGGESDRLTWRGDELPDERWLRETRKLGEKAANRFGLWGFGLLPEVCADRWAPDYQGAPTDGGPVVGPGPRVVRGGAAELSPWQGCGEWHLLLTAMRGHQQGWASLAARPVIGLNASR